MEYRIDGAVIPPGLFASAKTFSLILGNEGLYVIHTGPASGQPAGDPVRVNGVIQAAAANATTHVMQKRVAQIVAAGEARLNDKGPKACLQQKHSKLLTADQISGFNIKENLREIVLEIQSTQGKYKFRLPMTDKAMAETMQQVLRGLLGTNAHHAEGADSP